MKLNTLRSLSFALLATLLLLAACGTDPVEENNHNGIDTCDGMPNCMPGDREVQTCPDDADCYTESLCGYEILCERVSCDLPDSCPEGYEEVASCSGDDCLEVTTCDDEVLICEVLEVTCGGHPACPEGTTQVQSCEAGATCQQVTECNTTITCQTNAACEEAPTCPGGYQEVAECPDGSACIDVEGCDETLICEELPICDAIPVCDDGHPEVDQCPDGATCYTAEECGNSIICMSEGPTLCGEYSCPDGYSAATPCDNSADQCFLAAGCGEEILCGGAPAPSPCDASAACPAGWAPFDNCESAFDVCALTTICDDMIECAPQELVDDYQDPCDTSCPDGFSAVIDLDACVVGTGSGGNNDTIDGSLCLYIEACGAEAFCRADESLECTGAYDLCGSSYNEVEICSGDDNACAFGMACNDSSWCERL